MIAVRSESEIEKIATSCKYVAKVLGALKKMIKPGVTTYDLDKKAMEMTKKFGVSYHKHHWLIRALINISLVAVCLVVTRQYA